MVSLTGGSRKVIGWQADLWWAVEGVGVEDRLDHDEGLGQVLAHKMVAVVG